MHCIITHKSMTTAKKIVSLSAVLALILFTLPQAASAKDLSRPLHPTVRNEHRKEMAKLTAHPMTMGIVSAINGSILTLTHSMHPSTTTVITVDTTKATFQKVPTTTLSLTDIKVGDRLMIFGTRTGSNIEALRIVSLPPFRGNEKTTPMHKVLSGQKGHGMAHGMMQRISK